MPMVQFELFGDKWLGASFDMTASFDMSGKHPITVMRNCLYGNDEIGNGEFLPAKRTVLLGMIGEYHYYGCDYESGGRTITTEEQKLDPETHALYAVHEHYWGIGNWKPHVSLYKVVDTTDIWIMQNSSGHPRTRLRQIAAFQDPRNHENTFFPGSGIPDGGKVRVLDETEVLNTKSNTKQLMYEVECLDAGFENATGWIYADNAYKSSFKRELEQLEPTSGFELGNLMLTPDCFHTYRVATGNTDTNPFDVPIHHTNPGPKVRIMKQSNGAGKTQLRESPGFKSAKKHIIIPDGIQVLVKDERTDEDYKPGSGHPPGLMYEVICLDGAKKDATGWVYAKNTILKP